ncbi:transglutaminase domain-containing protein [Streptomyces sp. NPDC086091]|uniref:transglutaminase domain-containing protein n=1 Tax=Streptomyces sp. NPDC086091 TaxID=3365751 RepID=UPI00380B85A4
MTCAILTPWWRRRLGRTHAADAAGPAADDVRLLADTPILDWRHGRVRALADRARAAAVPGGGDRAFLVAAHRLVSAGINPVYAMDDEQPVSRTLALGRGSCSQRLAVLEAVARSGGVPTRVRGLLIDGSFWYPRFPRLRLLVPDQVVLAWPEFHVDGVWTAVSELYGSLDELRARNPRGFTNAGRQTLFEALSSTAVDWDGTAGLCGPQGAPDGGCGDHDLSAAVRADLGRFASRDALFARHGQTLSATARAFAGPFLNRRAAA